MKRVIPGLERYAYEESPPKPRHGPLKRAVIAVLYFLVAIVLFTCMIGAVVSLVTLQIPWFLGFSLFGAWLWNRVDRR